jgi:hypothetical protein
MSSGEAFFRPSVFVLVAGVHANGLPSGLDETRTDADKQSALLQVQVHVGDRS